MPVLPLWARVNSRGSLYDHMVDMHAGELAPRQAPGGSQQLHHVSSHQTAGQAQYVQNDGMAPETVVATATYRLKRKFSAIKEEAESGGERFECKFCEYNGPMFRANTPSATTEWTCSRASNATSACGSTTTRARSGSTCSCGYKKRRPAHGRAFGYPGLLEFVLGREILEQKVVRHARDKLSLLGSSKGSAGGDDELLSSGPDILELPLSARTCARSCWRAPTARWASRTGTRSRTSRAGSGRAASPDSTTSGGSSTNAPYTLTGTPTSSAGRASSWPKDGDLPYKPSHWTYNDIFLLGMLFGSDGDQPLSGVAFDYLEHYGRVGVFRKDQVEDKLRGCVKGLLSRYSTKHLEEVDANFPPSTDPERAARSPARILLECAGQTATNDAPASDNIVQSRRDRKGSKRGGSKGKAAKFINRYRVWYKSRASCQLWGGISNIKGKGSSSSSDTAV
ncbi:hypothetical protein BKA67DRAFT_538010 [Truncatella angustata]|uniref:Uncharacterized protein n=1 Tax=Truncatella angustata TaxID=152316 RepID=A0A9P8UHA5_9PEZI|nr:uncharacterized protein BKA67DRAFT_538010 [Truncatella angustata]KAH6652180.1 hypothetical protein BKA67DRAFT_538010 [Truncatella angustata]